MPEDVTAGRSSAALAAGTWATHHTLPTRATLSHSTQLCTESSPVPHPVQRISLLCDAVFPEGDVLVHVHQRRAGVGGEAVAGMQVAPRCRKRQQLLRLGKRGKEVHARA